ncbi:DUF6397 family protein [Streptomyces sp. NPDC101158]|uniref:DUF6397 family protein n=1 Tax=Streptomyces sp. NPDC101158 TaxID=3366117 RepID=UPI003808DBCA
MAPGLAAQELGLRRDEFQLAVDLGIVRTLPGFGPGTADVAAGPTRRRVARSEIERLRRAPDFPDGLRDRVRSVGMTEGARLLSVTKGRFARLAKTGHFSPVRFYVNRYRAIVWLYPAAELGEFALTHAGLLTGRLPVDVRTRAEGSEDWRPRNWRARRLGMLLRASADPWARTAAIASLLDPLDVAEVVDDPFERAYLERFRPAPPSWRPNAPAAREIADRLLLADDPDEILWHRMSLALALDEARADRQAPLPGAPAPAPLPVSALVPTPLPAWSVRPRAALPGADEPGAGAVLGPPGLAGQDAPPSGIGEPGAAGEAAPAGGRAPGLGPGGPLPPGPTELTSTGPAGLTSPGPAMPASPGAPWPSSPGPAWPASPGPAGLASPGPAGSAPTGRARSAAPTGPPGSAPTGPPGSAPTGPAGSAPAGPARAPGGTRPPGRRTRRSLLDRLRRRKEAGPRPGA